MRFDALGPLTVSSGGAPVPLRPAQRRLLASLLLTPDVPVPVDTLIDRLWNGAPPPTGRRAIHVHLSALRRRIPGVIDSRSDGYVLDLTDHDFDIPRFVALADRAGRRLSEGRFRDASDTAARAERLWRGDPFPDLADLDVARGERDRLSELLVASQTTQARALTLQGRVSESIALLRQLVAEQPLNESLWEELVLAYSTAGRAADARATLDIARETLSQELAVIPGPRLAALEQRVRRHDPELVTPVDAAMPNNLPALSSTFVGRDADLVAVSDLLDRQRLVTITGPPGIGKTRLAIEVASRRMHAHAAGTWFIRLTGAQTETDVLATLTSILAISEPVDGLDGFGRLLGPRAALVILDNCEQVLDSIRTLLGARRHGDRLRVLTTSRTRVGMTDETVWPLSGLALPTSLDELWVSDTMRLMVDRVRAADPNRDLTTTDQQGLLDLCRRTGGMPLAVELAARRIQSLEAGRVKDLAFARMEEARGSAPPSETSVADAVARSVALLDPQDRARFEAAAAFVAPFSAAAFGSVAGTSGDRDTNDVLHRLAEASLLTPERSATGAVHYRMLEPIRDFVRHGLDARPDVAAIRDRHAAWFVAAARTVAAATWSAAEADALDEVELTISDFRGAMRHLIDAGQPERAGEIAAGLIQFWVSRFLAWEGERWLTECLAYDTDDARRLEILAAASGVAFFVGRYDDSASLSQQVIDLARRHDDRHLEARGLYGVGRVEIHRRPPVGTAMIEQATRVYEDLGDRVAAAECLVTIGIQAAYAADSARAETFLTAPTALLEAEDYPRIASVGHRYLSLAAWHAGDEPTTRGHLDRAITLAERANDRRVLSGALAHSGLVETRWGTDAAAATAIVEALRLVNRQHAMYFALSAFGALALLVERADWSKAGRLLAHFDQIHRDCGWIPLDQRNASTADYRRRIAVGLAATGQRPDLAPMPTRVMADELTAELRAIAAAASSVS